MSKPDSAGDSLENILASIRASLAEQSTDALSEQAPAGTPSASGREAKPRRSGLTQRLAGAASTAEPHTNGAAADDLSDLLEVPSPAVMPRGDRDASRIEPSLSGPPPRAEPEKPAVEEPASGGDPLWFLSRSEEPAPPAGQAGQPAKDGKAAAEPELTRPEVLRASLPPFFGASGPETAVPAGGQPAPPETSTLPDPALVREVSLVAAAAEQAASRPAQAPPPPAADGRGTSSSDGRSEPGLGAAQEGQPNQALEAMVLDLLKPMLRQWLDENMPRLVAEALSEEVQRARAQKGGAGNT